MGVTGYDPIDGGAAGGVSKLSTGGTPPVATPCAEAPGVKSAEGGGVDREILDGWGLTFGERPSRVAGLWTVGVGGAAIKPS